MAVVVAAKDAERFVKEANKENLSAVVVAEVTDTNRLEIFHEGEKIQYGSHDELVSTTDGKYRELWNAQAQYYN